MRTLGPSQIRAAGHRGHHRVRRYQAWPAVVPAWATTGGLAATVLIGGLAGLYPAIRAARLPPAEGLAML